MCTYWLDCDWNVEVSVINGGSCWCEKILTNPIWILLFPGWISNTISFPPPHELFLQPRSSSDRSLPQQFCMKQRLDVCRCSGVYCGLNLTVFNLKSSFLFWLLDNEGFFGTFSSPLCFLTGDHLCHLAVLALLLFNTTEIDHENIK